MMRGMSRTALAGLVGLALVGGSSAAAVAADAGDDADVTPPVVRVGGLEPGGVYELGAEFTLEFSCEDPESGIVSCTESHGYSSGDTVRLDVDGPNVFRVTGVNGAGLEKEASLEVWAQVAEIQGIQVVFDGNRPSFNGWYNAPLAATIRAWRDDELPIREIRYRVDGGEWQIVPGSEAAVPFEEEGRFLLEYIAYDSDMGISTQRRHWVNLDLTAPDISYPEGIDGGVFPQWFERALSAECGDELSGVDVCAFDEGAWLPTDEPGEHTVTARGVDDAGNVVTRVLHYTVVAADMEPGGSGDPGETPSDAPAAPPAPTSAPGSLARTGADSPGVVTLLIGGLGLVAVGTAAAMLTRRRRSCS